MSHTPFFPAWDARLNPMGCRTTKAFRKVRAYTLCQLETSFALWTPSTLFPKTARRHNSRDRDYTRWQGFNPLASGREVVRQLQALFELENRPPLSPEDGAYCRAKARLPLDQFPLGLSATAKAADQLAAPLTLFQGRPIKVTDGSALTLRDMPWGLTSSDGPPVASMADGGSNV